MSNSTSNRVYCRFSPPPQFLEADSSISLMSQTSPIISSALSHSFPILLILDNILSFITWTNDDPYYNFLCISGLVALVLKWSDFSIYFMPLLFALVFCCFSWPVISIYDETSISANSTNNMQDDTRDIPTIQEILDTLENISTRFEILLSPLLSLKELTLRDELRLALLTIWITPLQIFILKHFVLLDKAVIAIIVTILTYHSPWAIATRRLLWRSVYVRKLTYALTGFKPVPQNEPYNQKGFKIISDKQLSSGKNGKMIQFEILENQRRWIAIGWSGYMLPYERSNFTTISLFSCKSPEEFELTTIHASHSWKWLENSWSIDYDFNKNKDGEGWLYYDTNWKYPSYYDGMTKYTRSRKWKRKALLVVDKPSQ